jgi:hypothetical protein
MPEKCGQLTCTNHFSNAMTLTELIDEYKQMAAICNQVDYDDKQSVRRNNKAVKRMYQIVEKIKTSFGDEGVKEFIRLIDIRQNRVDLWAAIQMLEKMQVDKETEKKALTIISEEAKESLGYQYWLKSYKEGKK